MSGEDSRDNPPGMSRRQFMALAALGLATSAIPGCATTGRENTSSPRATPDAGRQEGSMRMRLHEAYWINGVPVLGVFNVRSLEDLQIAHETGFNLAAYAPREMLDPATPMGKYALDNGMKAMYSATGPAHGSPRLAASIDARATTIPYELGRKPDPGPGIVVIEDERVRYAESTDTELRGCQRGADGTRPTPHRAGIIMFWPEPFAAYIREVKDSPNLWGYWALDDTPGLARSVMIGVTRVVREVDGKHPLGAGYTGPDTMANFGPGACDVIIPYWYPVLKWGYDRQMTAMDTQAILTSARRHQPGVPYMGLYQAFWGGDWNKRGPLTAFEIREQAEDFVREGAAGLMAFAILHKEKATDIFGGFNLDPEMTHAVKEINEEIRATCALEVPPERPEMARIRIRPVGFHEREEIVPGVPPAWHVAYPFDAGETPGLDTQYPPDAGIDLNATYAGKDGQQVRWEVAPTNTGTLAWLYFHGHVSTKGTNTVAYAVCTVTSATERNVQVRLGSDRETLVRIDGNEIWRFERVRGIHMDDSVAWGTLRAGTSEIVVKVIVKQGAWGFCLRLADLDGRPLDGVTFSPSA